MAPLPATPADVHNQGLQDEADDSTFFDDVEAIEPSMTDGEEGKWVDDFLGEEEEPCPFDGAVGYRRLWEW